MVDGVNRVVYRALHHGEVPGCHPDVCILLTNHVDRGPVPRDDDVARGSLSYSCLPTRLSGSSRRHPSSWFRWRRAP